MPEDEKQSAKDEGLSGAASTKPTQQASHDTEEHVRLFIDHAPAALAMFDREMRYLYASRRWSADYALGDLNLRGAFLSDVFPNIPDRWKEAHRRGLAGEAVSCDADRFQRLDGLVQWIRWEISPWLNAAGDVGGIIVFSEDITAQKNAAEELERREEHIHTLLESTAEAILGSDPDGTCTFCNPSALRLLGYENSSELVGKNLHSVMHYFDAEGQNLPLERCQIHRARKEGKPIHAHDQRFWRKDGSSFTADCWSHPILDRGQLCGAVLTFFDITESKKAEETSSLLRAALEATANAVVITDRAGTIEWTNPAFTKLTGYAAGEVLGQTPRILRSGTHSREFYSEMWETILDNRVWTGEVVNRRKDGSLYTEEMTITPIRTSVGQFSHFVAVKQDISARTLLEKQLQQAQKMEAIGTLAGQVAHDFNNLLGVISAGTGIFDDHIGDDTMLGGIVEEIRTAVDSAKALTSQLLAFSRRQVLQPQLISPNVVIHDTVKMLNRILGEDVILSLDLESNIGNVEVDGGQLQQVIMNLAVNARDAMPEGGSLQITSANIQQLSDALEKDGIVPPGNYVKLTITDNGIGMDDEIMRRAFEPFFTTKPVGRGSGLGLSTVYGIVKQSGGYVFLSSRPGEGTTAEVYLPRAAGSLAQPGPRCAVPTLRRLGTILLVEDNASLQRMIRRGLESRGYSVIAAPNGEEALKIAFSCEKNIDLLLTDCIMPGMNGADLAKRVMQTRRDISVLYMSGYAAETLGDRNVIDSDVMFIKKPFELGELIDKIREALGTSDHLDRSA